ncbi:unnamed protein product [Camellia sinensis]
MSGGAQTNSTTRSNLAGDARLPAVGGLGGLGLPEMFGSMQDTAFIKSVCTKSSCITDDASSPLQPSVHESDSWSQSPAEQYAGFQFPTVLIMWLGNVDLRRKTNYLIVDSKTTVKQIEEAFKEFTTREDVVIVMISQYT